MKNRIDRGKTNKMFTKFTFGNKKEEKNFAFENPCIRFYRSISIPFIQYIQEKEFENVKIVTNEQTTNESQSRTKN